MNITDKKKLKSFFPLIFYYIIYKEFNIFAYAFFNALKTKDFNSPCVAIIDLFN